MRFDSQRVHLVAGLGYAALGIILGMHMAATHDHGQSIAHDHLLLVGFLLSLSYAIIHRLWLVQPRQGLAVAQCLVHHVGTLALVTGLFLLYGGHQPLERLEPLLGSASFLVLLALILMMVMVLASRARPAASPAAES